MNNYLYHYLSKFILLFMLALALSGCGGGGDPASQQNPPVDDPAPVPNIPASQSIAGGGIKGPLADAAVTIFAFDATKPGFKGAIVATASTDASAAITGLNLPLPSNPPYVMEFTSVPGVTTDITTGMAPVITALRTVITRSQLDSGEDIYATTLTTLAVDIAVLNAVDSNGIAGIQADEFEAALALSAKKVVSTLGFGLDRSVDIFSTPPLINRATVSAAQQTDVAAYRAAVEAVAAIVYQIAQQSGSVTADAVLGDLAADIADNDSIDGSSGGTLNVNTLQVLQQDPASLIIPDTSPVQTVADVHSILDAEKVITGSTTDTSRLLDGTIITQLEPVRTDVDSDGDGVINVEDDLPENKDESVDSDGDGIGDNTDPDDDNDGILDVDEGQVPSPTVNDTDGDGFDDGVDNCPADFNPSQTDTNADLEGDACDPDDDGDGVNDTEDAFPHDATRTIDTDSDGEDDSTDTDDDNDGLPDDLDTGLGQDGSTSCSLLIDCDGDGVLDGADADHTDANIGIRFAPVANDDSATVNEGQSVIIDLVVNDTIAGAGNSGVVASSSGGSVMIDPASIVIITQPVNGALVVNADGTVDYTHDASETVTDSFSYTIRDTGGLVSNVAGVNITVAPVNDVPVANDDSAMVDEGQSVNIDLAVNDTDVDNALDLGSISIVQAPSNGSLVVNVNGTVDYTHDGSETLVDSFSYSIRDVSGAVSGVANVSLVINPLNNAPVANADSASTNEGQGVNLNLVLNDTDVDSAIDVSSIVIVSAVSNGLLTVNANGTVDYIHDGSETLTDSFSYTIRDVSGALSNTAVVNITIIPVNDAPVAGADTASLNEGQSVNIDLAANDTDVDDALDLGSIAISSAPSNGLLVINANGTVDYTHDGSKTVSDSFSYTIRDASGAVSNTAIVTLNITLQNDVPVANIDSASVNEGQSVNIDLAANDTDTEGPVDLTSIVISSMPTNGSVAVNVNGTVDYTHDGSETLADNFSYTIRDADGAVSNVAAVSLAINPQNDAPVANNDSGGVNEGQVVILDLVANDTDADNAIDLASINIVSAPVNGSLVVNADGTVSYTHNGSGTLSDSFTYTIRDVSAAVSNVATVNLIITAQNDAPVANADAGSVNEGQSVNIDLAANDTDVDNAIDLGSITIVAAPVNGALVINANGTVDYTHDGSETLADSFSYTIRDISAAVSNIAMVNLAVNPQNDVPVANADTGNVNEGQSVNINLAANDTDVDSALDLGSIVITSAPINGSVVVNANGSVDYTHDGSETLVDSFSYSIRDTSGAISNIANVSLGITPLNTPPLANADSGSVNEGQSTRIDLAVNDTDVDNALDLGSIIITSGPVNGSVVVNADGTVDYTHDGSETLADNFSYTIRDALGAVSNVAAVSISVNAVNDAPIANADSASVDEGQSVNIDLAANDTDVEGPVDLSSVTIVLAPTRGVLVVNANGTVDYTHDGSETLSDSFSYTIRDGSGAVSNTASVSITVNAVNDAPVANSDNASVNEGQSVNINLVANDTDAENALDLSSITIVVTPANGALVINANGTVGYTHDGSATIADSFTYTIRDTSGAVSNIATVDITITPQNDAPVANADNANVNEAQSVNINLAANDTDIDNAIDLASITIVSMPVNGSLVVNANGSVDYTHDGSETLADSFTYTIRDALGAISNTAVVNISVNAINDVPVANADNGSVNEGQSVNLDLAANDTDADNALDLGSIVITSFPSNGSVVVNVNGSVDYTHDGSETLTDSFSYTIRDASAAVSAAATVTLSVIPVNDAPLAAADTGSVNEGQSININLAANDVDVDSAIDLTSITIIVAPSNGVLVVNVNGSVAYTHDGSETLSDSFSYTIRDTSGAVSNTATVNLTVVPQNDAPVANADSGNVNEGQSLNLNLAANDTDAEGSVDLTSIVISSAPSNGSVVVNINGTVDYTHDGSETLTDSFTYTIRDAAGATSNVATVSLDIVPQNDAPVANADSASVDEGQSVVINLTANDTDAEGPVDVTSIVITSPPVNGSLVVNANGTVDYTHDGSETLTDSFAYTVKDASVAVSNTATVSLSVNAINDAPVAGADNGIVNEGQSISLNLAANDSDVDNALDLTSITIVAAPGNGSVIVNGNGTVDYTHDGSETLVDSFTYTIRDISAAVSNTATVNLTVVPQNDAPVANADSGNVNEGQSISLNLAANDSDVDNALDLTSITIVAAPGNGSVVINANGTVDYTHDGSETLVDSFSYTIRDASAAVSNIATVSLTVNPQNDAPVANADSASVNEGQSININLALNDTDVDNALDLSSIVISSAPANGSVIVNANGSVDYTHDGSETLADSFTYTIRDASGASSQVAVVSLSIIAVNDAPVANADSGNVNEGQSLNLNLAANDSDVDNALDLASITIVAAPGNGSVVINANGTVDYTHDGSETLVDSFSYTIRDVSAAVSNIATVSLTVNPQNDAPVANADSASVNEGQSININLALNDTDVDNALDLTSIVISSAPANGSVIVNANGSVDYTHDGSETLVDSFSYTIRDASGASSQVAVVSLSIIAVNDAPVANADSGNVNEGQSISLNLAANDSDVDNALDLASITIVAAPGNGSVVINANGTVDYTHDGSETLVDSFSYTIRDASAAVSNIETVSLTVNPQNDAPVANVDNGNVNEGQSINLDLAANDTDVDNALDLTSITIVAAPANGALIVNANGSVDYTHDGSETLVDSFSYTIRDASAAVSNIATVSLTINPQNDAPVANADSASVDEGLSVNINLALNDTDAENALDLASMTIVTAPANGSVIVNANGTVDYTHDGSETLADSFSYTIRDTSAAVSQVATVTLTIVPVNDPPVGNVDSFTVDATTATVLDVLANDTDVDGGVLSISNVSQGSKGSTVTHDGSTITFTDVNNISGSETFTYDLTDGIDIVTGINVTVTIVANVPPVANADSASTDEDTAVLIPDVLANDTDGGDGPGVLSVSSADALSVSGGNVVDNGDGTFNYTPAQDFNGIDSFNYTVSDTASTSVGTVSITVNAINDAPVAVSDVDTVAEDTQLTTINVLANDTDVENDILSVAAVDASTAAGGAIVNNGDGTFNYTPVANFNGNDTFSYTVTDGLLNATGVVSINVAPVNDAPVATDDSVAETPSQSGTIIIPNVLANDTDVDGDVLTAAKATDPSNGLVIYNGGGVFTYSPTAGFVGTDSFTYTVSDASTSDVGTVTVTVLPPGLPIDILTLMSSVEGGVVGIKNEEANVYTYYTNNFNPINPVFQTEEKIYNHLSGLFDTVVNTDDLLLSGTQWLSEGAIVGTPDTNGGLDLSVRDATSGTVEMASFKLTARVIDLNNVLMVDHLNTVWRGAMFNPNARFGLGARLITDYRLESLIESYIIGQDNTCQKDGTTKYADLNNNCNSVDVDIVVNATGYAQSLGDVVAATPWIDPNNDFSTPPGAISIATNKVSNKTLMVQLVSGGAANYYVVDNNGTNPISFVSNAVAGSGWTQNTSSGVDMIHLQVPASFIADFLDVLSNGKNYFLTVQNGFVRKGLKHAAGDIEFSSGQFNGNAFNEIMANFTAPVTPGLADLTGTWVSSTVSVNGDPMLLHIFNNGYYESSGSCDRDGSTGMEYGTVSASGATNNIIALAQVASQGACGPAQGNKVLSVNGGVLTISELGFADVTFTKLLGAPSPIVGSWLRGNIQDAGEAHTVLTMLDNTTFVLSQDCVSASASGFEYGTYVWDQGNTNSLTGTLTINDSNGSCGLHNNTALNISGFTVDVVGDTLTLTDTSAGGVSTIYTRISPAYVIPVLQVVYTLDNVLLQPGDGQITGSFTWSYQAGNFAGGTGQFTSLTIPGYGSDIAPLTIAFDVQIGITINLAVNTNNNGVNINLDFVQPLSPTLPSSIDLGASAYEIEIGKRAGAFIDGTISPQPVP